MATRDGSLLLSRLVVASVFGLVATGCFDVHGVDPGPYVLDDFEDGDLVPADPLFAPWYGYAFNPDSNKMCQCQWDLDTGLDSSNHALRLTFTVTDRPNGIQEEGGAGLASLASRPVDFATFHELDFNVSLASGDPPLSKDAQLHVELGCSTATDEDGKVPGNFFVTRGADYDVNWQSKRFTLANFGLPAWIKTPIQGGLAGCLSRVDSIRFTVNAEVPDGQTGRGSLLIDNVLLR